MYAKKHTIPSAVESRFCVDGYFLLMSIFSAFSPTFTEPHSRLYDFRDFTKARLFFNKDLDISCEL